MNVLKYVFLSSRFRFLCILTVCLYVELVVQEYMGTVQCEKCTHGWWIMQQASAERIWRGLQGNPLPLWRARSSSPIHRHPPYYPSILKPCKTPRLNQHVIWVHVYISSCENYTRGPLIDTYTVKGSEGLSLVGWRLQYLNSFFDIIRLCCRTVINVIYIYIYCFLKHWPKIFLFYFSIWKYLKLYYFVT